MGAPRDISELSFARSLPLTRAATRFARQWHAGQRRAGDRAPFVAHPLEVAALLERSGCPDHVVAAGVLHDVLEDTDVDRRQLESLFGSEVAELVATVSDDPSIDDEDARKDDVRDRVRRHGGYALMVYAADKVSKVRELRAAEAVAPDDHEAAAKLRRHRASLAMLEDAMPGNRLVELLRFEIEALETLPPGSAGTRRR